MLNIFYLHLYFVVTLIVEVTIAMAPVFFQITMNKNCHRNQACT